MPLHGGALAAPPDPRGLRPRVGRLWKTVRKVWVTLGIGAAIVFVAWSLIAYRASPEGREAAESDARVMVTHENGVWTFLPEKGVARDRAGLLFFPGALVEPRAYAPLLRAAAEAGHLAVMVELPRRGAFGGADSPEVLFRADEALDRALGPLRWVLAGHSRGAVVASEEWPNLAPVPVLGGLVIIGSSHPRDVDLSKLAVPVTKIVGTRDGLASPREVEANRHLLPPSTRWVWIEGGNHSHFGWYGFQPGDHRATLPAAEQRERMTAAVLGALRLASGAAAPAPISQERP